MIEILKTTGKVLLTIFKAVAIFLTIIGCKELIKVIMRACNG